MRGAIPARCTDLDRESVRDLHEFFAAATRAVHPAHLVDRALTRPDVSGALARAHRVAVVAAGKAAAHLFAAWHTERGTRTSRAVVTAAPWDGVPAVATCIASSHPYPDAGSEAAGVMALEFAQTLRPDEWLVLLISGGASAMLALPRDGLTIGDKVATARALMRAGADIQSLNRVRTHLSAIKGGGLARAARGRVVTLAISDVCGQAEDDPLVIGSGPGILDRSTVRDARDVLDRFAVLDQVPPRVRAFVDAPHPRSVAGDDVDEPAWAVIGSRREAMAGAADAARARGYRVVVIPDAVTGDAREAGAAWVARVRAACAGDIARERACVISSGETTMTVTGAGRGGRNQEFALAVALRLAEEPVGLRRDRPMIAICAGTDGIDGQSPAAGAVVDATTVARAHAAGLDIADVRARNDTFGLFACLGDAVVTGPTGTNVGDLQVALVG